MASKVVVELKIQLSNVNQKVTSAFKHNFTI